MEHIAAKTLLAGLVPAQRLADGQDITLVTTDSREVIPGCVFVAFPGEHFDGHDFAARALEAGAAWVVLNHPVEGVPEEKDHPLSRQLPGHDADGRQLPRPVRPQSGGRDRQRGARPPPRNSAPSPSAGWGQTIKTEGNQNNELGLPRTLFPDRRQHPICGDRDGDEPCRGDQPAVPLRPARCGGHHLHRPVPHRQPGQPGEHLQGQAGDLRRDARGRAAGPQLR